MVASTKPVKKTSFFFLILVQKQLIWNFSNGTSIFKVLTLEFAAISNFLCVLHYVQLLLFMFNSKNLMLYIVVWQNSKRDSNLWEAIDF